MTKNNEFENYFDARISIHEALASAMRRDAGLDYGFGSMTLRVSAIGALVASALAVFASMGGGGSLSLGIWPLVLVASFYLFTSRGANIRAAADVEETVNRAKNTAMSLHGLYGAPHDRFRNDAKAAHHAAIYRQALETPPMGKYFATAFLYMIGIAGIAYSATMGAFVDGYSPFSSWLVIAQCLCVIPGFVLHRKYRNRLQEALRNRADIAAFHLAEFGLTIDGKFESGTFGDSGQGGSGRG